MKLIAYVKSSSGGMMGGAAYEEIKYTEEGKCYFYSRNKQMHSSPTVTNKYYADGLLDKLSAVCERYNVSSWYNLPDTDIFMYDAASTSITFTFEDGTNISIGDRTKCPDMWLDFWDEFRELIKQSKDYAVDEVTETEESVNMFGMGMMAMGMMGDPMSNNMIVNVQNDTNCNNATSIEESKWAKFCIECGNGFSGAERFCGNCGAPRQKK